jgi:hypothetical protein
MAKRFFSIKNLDKYQHYHDGRAIKWVKLYVGLLDDYEFSQLSDKSKGLYPFLILLSAKCDNKIPDNPKWVKEKIGFGSTPDLKELVSHGFLIPYNSVPDDTGRYGEERKGEENRGEEEESPTPAEPVPISYSYETQEFSGITGKDMEVWIEAYPAVDIQGNVSRAGVWLQSNPSKKKKNIRKFLTSWFARTQESGGDKKPKTNDRSKYDAK